MMNQKTKVPIRGRLGILTPGMGAVSTTFMAGVLATRAGWGRPIGSLTQMGSIKTEEGEKQISDLVPLAKLEDIVFGGWDIFSDNAYEAASRAQVLDQRLLDKLKDELSAIRPMSAVFSSRYVRNISGPNIKTGSTLMDLAEQLIDDIHQFKHQHQCERLVMIWCASTEAYLEPSDVHKSLEAFEKGLCEDDASIAPSQIYAYAAIRCGVAFANGAPNLTCDIPALLALANEKGVPISGKDFKTGQTLMKTIVAPGLKARALGVNGWFSTNILGNRDGAVLDDPANFKSKEVSKGNVLEGIFNAQQQPELYSDLYHKIRINYYPPRGDDKESWDNIDIFGWLGYPMQIKINFLCKDSILAAPIAMDLALFSDLAQRCHMSGIQEWLSFYYKAPQTIAGTHPQHDLFKQLTLLESTLLEISKTYAV